MESKGPRFFFFVAQGEGLQLLGEDLMGRVWKWHGFTVYIYMYASMYIGFKYIFIYIYTYV